MVTDEMLKRAIEAYANDTGAEGFQLEGWIEPAIKSALEASLSAAEPTRWMWEERRSAESDIWDDMYDDEAPAPHKYVRNVRPLYAAPPAPSVAVKALEWDEFSTELKRHFQSNAILGQYQISYLGEFECWQLYSPQKSSTWKENFSRHTSSDEAKAAGQADYEARIRSALSAQVQDDNEIVDCLLAGKPFVFDPATNFCHAVDGGAPEHGIKYVPTAQVQDVAIPEGWQLAPVEPTAGMIAAAKSTTSAALTRSHATEIYRAMLAAAPAKQEGGKSKPVHNQSVDSGESGDE